MNAPLPNTELDQQLTLSLPVWAWIVIGNQTRKGAYEEVADILTEMHRQLMAQVRAPEPPIAAERDCANQTTPPPPCSEPELNPTKMVH